MKNNSLNLRDDLSRVSKEFPELELFLSNGNPYKLEGPLEIFDNEGNKRGFYEIQIVFDYLRYPHLFPTLKEISNKIPKIKDRHIYENTGTCCVTVLQKQAIEANKGISIYDYIKRYAVPYFANQIYFEEIGKWANGDYYHGDLGQIQYYVETFKTTDLAIICHGINMAVEKRLIGRNAPCFCGSTTKFKRCHQSAIEEIGLIGESQMRSDINKIIKLRNAIEK